MLFVSFKEFLALSKNDLESKTYVDNSISVTHTFKQLEALAKTVSPLLKTKRAIFGSRFPDGTLDLRFFSAKKMRLLSQVWGTSEMSPIDDIAPSMSDILRACQHDEYSTPLLLMTSSEMVTSEVWLDENDPKYISDLLRAIISSIQIFESDIKSSDARKRQMYVKLVPAGATEGVMSNADEICHRGSDKTLFDLDKENIVDRIHEYNLRLSSYDKIMLDIKRNKREKED